MSHNSGKLPRLVRGCVTPRCESRTPTRVALGSPSGGLCNTGRPVLKIQQHSAEATRLLFLSIQSYSCGETGVWWTINWCHVIGTVVCQTVNGLWFMADKNRVPDALSSYISQPHHG
ncbi:hypothetical protein T4D_93 [Trichinella pseudospiralis]|uniref:Uncharacterized protein n=1 Tax=Trichinella pseudospiralis TaxID=6337 RepID=A0A0V1FRI5_TRIPS|nr:hypothetical protein T4D_93 [Trichinella pseudospiralis]